MTSANIKHKNTFLNWRISIAIGLVLSAGLNATAGTGYQIETIAGDGTLGLADVNPATSAKFKNPRGICRDSAGNTYIADTDNNRIRKITASGVISSLFPGLPSPYGVCVDSSENICVSCFNTTATSGFVRKYDRLGNVKFTKTGLHKPYGICLDSAGNLYVANYGNSTLGKYNSAGGPMSTSLISGLNGPTGVYVDGSGNIYVTNSGSNSLAKYNSAGGVISTNLISGLNNPNGVCLDSAGNVYVGDTNNGQIKRLSVSDNSITTIASDLNGPCGVYVDSTNNVYVSETTGQRIRKLTAAPTTQLFTVAPGGSQTLSGTLSKAFIAGGGTAILPVTNSISEVEVNNGILQVSGSAPITFNASGGSAMVEILAAIRTGAFTLRTPGAVKIATGIAAILDAPSGTSLMSKTGAGRLRAIDNLSSSTTPVAVSEGILEVSGSTGKLPTAAISVASGGILQLGTSGGTVASGAVPGPVDIASGGIVVIADGVTVPSNVFSNAAIPVFRGGSTLQLRAGATFSQPITVVP